MTLIRAKKGEKRGKQEQKKGGSKKDKKAKILFSYIWSLIAAWVCKVWYKK